MNSRMYGAWDGENSVPFRVVSIANDYTLATRTLDEKGVQDAVLLNRCLVALTQSRSIVTKMGNLNP